MFIRLEQSEASKLMELISIKEAPTSFKAALLKALGLDVDMEGYVVKDGVPVTDKYTGKMVRMNNMAIFPGSTIVLDDNPLSIASYVEEYGEV